MRALLIAACAAALSSAGGAWAADPAAGKAIAAKVCAACHGAEGDKPVAPENPILAGQYQDYLARALTDYKSGKRANPVMKAFAGQLSKKDIQDVAAWFSSQQSKLHFQR
jgi:cytochrome c553